MYIIGLERILHYILIYQYVYGSMYTLHGSSLSKSSCISLK